MRRAQAQESVASGRAGTQAKAQDAIKGSPDNEVPHPPPSHPHRRARAHTPTCARAPHGESNLAGLGKCTETLSLMLHMAQGDFRADACHHVALPGHRDCTIAVALLDYRPATAVCAARGRCPLCAVGVGPRHPKPTGEHWRGQLLLGRGCCWVPACKDIPLDARYSFATDGGWHHVAV